MRATGRGPWADEDAPADATSIALHTGRPVPVVPEQPPSPATAAEDHAPAPAGWRLPSRLAGEGSAPATPAAEAPPASGAPSRGRAGRARGPAQLRPPLRRHPARTPLARRAAARPRGRARAVPRVARHRQHQRTGHRPRPDRGCGGPGRGTSHPLRPDPASPGRHRAGAATAACPGSVHGAAPARPLPAPGGGLIDSVPWRSGGSNVAPPETPLASEAPLISQAPPEASPTAQPHRPAEPRPGGVTTPPPAPTLRPAAPAAPAAPPAAPAAPGPVPAAGPVQADPGDAVAEDLDVDEDAEATVDRSALLAAAAHRESGPLVLAVLCSAGHPSPPHAGTCRTCAREIPAQQPFQTPRPPLGVLRLCLRRRRLPRPWRAPRPLPEGQRRPPSG